MAENLPLGVKLQVTGTEEYKRAMADAEARTKQFDQALANMAKSQKAAADVSGRLATGLKNISSPQYAEALKKMDSQLVKTAADLDKAEKETMQLAKALGLSEHSVNKLEQEFGELRREAGLSTRAMKDAGTASSQSASIFGNLKTAILGMAAGFTAMEVGRQVVAMIGNAIEVTKLYETALFDVTTQMQAANREFGLFDSQASTTTDMVKKLADQFRVYSDRDVANALARTVQMTKRLGFSEEQMMTLLSRTADLSAGKVELAAGIERVTAAMGGEAESAEYLGLTLNDSYLATQSQRLGFSKLWKDMSYAEKYQVRYVAYLEQSEQLQGRSADSADTLAGAQGELNKEWERTQVSLGEIFIPSVLAATTALANFLDVASGGPRTMAELNQMAVQMAGDVGGGVDFQRRALMRRYGLPGISTFGGGMPYARDYTAASRAGTYDFGTITPFSGGRGASQQGMQENTNEEMRRLEEERLADEEASRQKLADSWQRQADAHANMVQNIIDQQEDLNLSVAQSQERFNLDWKQKREDLEREIGIKVAEGFGKPEDQAWWINQRMIDFEREQRQAQEQLTLRNQQSQERLNLNAQQAGVQLTDLESSQTAELQATTEYYEQDLNPAIKAKQQEITDVLRDEIYPQRMDDWNLELAQEKAEMESAWSSMKTWILSHPLPAFQIGSSAAEGTELDDTSDSDDGAQFGMSGIVNRLRSITVGEGNRPEYVRVTPMGYGGGSTQFVRNFNQQVHMSMGTRSSADAQNIANQVKANMDRGARLSSQFGG